MASKTFHGVALTGLLTALAGCGGGGSSGSSGGSSPPPAPPPPPPPPAFTALAHQPPVAGYLSLLLTDGSVMMQSNTDSGQFYRLTPDASGSYVNGTWSTLAPMPAGYEPYAGAEAVLADGRVLFVGGEYNQNIFTLPFAPTALTNMSAVYDPVTNSWTMIAPPAGVPYIGDPPQALLPDGSFLFGTKLGRAMYSLDPATLTWTAKTGTGKADDYAEEGWTLLPNGNVLTVDLANGRHSEHYVPALDQWFSDGDTPVSLTSVSSGGLAYGPAPVQTVGGITYGPGPAGVYFPPGEIGPALLRPDGSVFATGSAPTGTAHTAIYRPGASASDPGTWSAGPDFPSGDDADDASAALTVDGHVLIATPSGRFYDFDGAALNLKASLSAAGNTIYFLLPLPNGQVLVTGGATQVYTPAGSAQATWAPTVTTAPATVTRGSTYAVSGTQFNGLSQAASVGDELNAATNYPLVRLTNTATGHVTYARTHDHSSMGVATGSLVVTTHFDVPATAETGASTLVVVANGIASAPVNLTVN